jgi:anthranilate 1,2-dioxygenase large subunit
VVGEQDSLHNCTWGFHTEDASGGAAYKQSGVSSFKEGIKLEDLSFLNNKKEFDEGAFQIQAIFPQLFVRQIENSLVARQILPKGAANFELIFRFFGYADDTPEMRMHRIKQINLVGPSGLVSMEDALATELVQLGTAGRGDALSMADMCRDVPNDPQTASGISDTYIRRFWRGLSGADGAMSRVMMTRVCS